MYATFSAALATFVAITFSPSTYASKTIDLSNSSEPGGPFEISFCSRPSPEAGGLPGHSFVAFSAAGPNNTRTLRAAGLQPSSLGGALASLVTQSDNGYVATERYTALKQSCLTVKVNRKDYDRAWGSALPSFTALGIADVGAPYFENYGLGSEDCVGYITRVAKTLVAAGLKVPERKAGEFPRPYVQRLEKAN